MSKFEKFLQCIADKKNKEALELEKELGLQTFLREYSVRVIRRIPHRKDSEISVTVSPELGEIAKVPKKTQIKLDVLLARIKNFIESKEWKKSDKVYKVHEPLSDLMEAKPGEELKFVNLKSDLGRHIRFHTVISAPDSSEDELAEPVSPTPRNQTERMESDETI